MKILDIELGQEIKFYYIFVSGYGYIKMPKKPDNQLFILPDIDNESISFTRQRRKSLLSSSVENNPLRSKKRDETAMVSKQAFLPGLSRRGRPRLAQPVSAVDRTAEHRRKRIEQGAKRFEVILDPQVFSALNDLTAYYKEPRSEVISKLILNASLRVTASLRKRQIAQEALKVKV